MLASSSSSVLLLLFWFSDAQMLRRSVFLTAKSSSSAFFFSPTTSIGMNSRKRRKPSSYYYPLMSNSRSIESSSLVAAGSVNDHRQQHSPLVIVIAGPTAVGKSDVASKLCSSSVASDITTTTASCGHIVSADSVQAYRGVDIGANKPTAEELACTPHHLVNVVDPPTDPNKAASYNAADWLRDASYIIRELTLSDKNKNDDDNIGLDDNDDTQDFDEEASLRRQSIDAYLKQTIDNSSNKESRSPILPVVVGGTMMYLNWFVHGRPDATRSTKAAVERAATKVDSFREFQNSDGGDDEELEALDASAWRAASSYVSSLGPVFQQRVGKLPGKDWYRLRRLLEVAYTISSEKMKQGDDTNKTEECVLNQLTEAEVYTGTRSGSLKDQGYDVRCFFLCPSERMEHFKTVDQRCEQMLQRGLLKETATLYVKGLLPDDSQVTRAIGYRQALEYLQRKEATNDDHDSLANFIDNFATATRQYAKKQMQWFRRDNNFVFVPVNMDLKKEERTIETARIITDMCKLSAAEFEAELKASDEYGNVPLSAKIKTENELQGKKMKFFTSKRHILSEGSDEFLSLLKEADECTKLVQSMEFDVKN